jgi:hypothetical protein
VTHYEPACLTGLVVRVGANRINELSAVGYLTIENNESVSRAVSYDTCIPLFATLLKLLVVARSDPIAVPVRP